jgi:hypothetical protein
MWWSHVSKAMVSQKDDLYHAICVYGGLTYLALFPIFSVASDLTTVTALH